MHVASAAHAASSSARPGEQAAARARGGGRRGSSRNETRRAARGSTHRQWCTRAGTAAGECPRSRRPCLRGRARESTASGGSARGGRRSSERKDFAKPTCVLPPINWLRGDKRGERHRRKQAHHGGEREAKSASAGSFCDGASLRLGPSLGRVARARACGLQQPRKRVDSSDSTVRLGVRASAHAHQARRCAHQAWATGRAGRAPRRQPHRWLQQRCRRGGDGGELMSRQGLGVVI